MEAPPIVVLSVTVTGLFKLITPVPAAEIVPATEIEAGAVAVTPPVKARLSLAASPKTKAPVSLKVTAFVIVPPLLICTP